MNKIQMTQFKDLICKWGFDCYEDCEATKEPICTELKRALESIFEP